MTRRRCSLGIALASVTLALGACTYEHDETELGSLDAGAVEARVVFVEHAQVEVQCGEGALSVCWPGSVRSKVARLDVEGPHPFSVPVPGRLMPFDRVELASNEDGSRIAYRRVVSEGHEPWRQVFAGERGHGYVSGPMPSDDDDRPDWSGAAEFEDAAPDLFRHGSYKTRTHLLADVRQRYGASGLTQMLMETVDVRTRGPRSVRRGHDGAWGEALDGLDRESKRRVVKRLRHRFLNDRLGKHGVVRALRHLDLSQPEVLDKIQRKLHRDGTFGRRKLADAIMLRALSRHRPQRAGKIACARLEGVDHEPFTEGGATARDFYREALLLGVVAGGTPCQAVDPIAAHANVSASESMFTKLHDKSERLRPKRDYFSAERKAVSEKRMKRLIAAAAAASEPVRRPKHRRPHHCRIRHLP